jgi:hypothetical protein
MHERGCLERLDLLTFVYRRIHLSNQNGADNTIICMDESPKQLISESRTGQKMKPALPTPTMHFY